MKETPTGEHPTVRSRPKPRFEPGQTLGRYRLLDEVGRGGMGVVYVAEDASLHRRVAVKVLAGSDGLNETARLRFEREARAMARLSQRNVVAVHDFGFHEGSPFIVMELIVGTSLRRWLTDAPRPWREVVAKFVEAGQGLVAAHAESIVHRDFKPENVLVAADGRAVVTDFGIARDLVQAGAEPAAPGAGGRQGELTGASSLIGTPRYMAPEQFALEPVSEQTDQFSFGVALYEALYGRHPFLASDAETDPVAVGAKIVAAKLGPTPAGTDVPPRVHEVLRRMLHPEPGGRFASMKEALRALQGIDEAPPARPRRSRLPALASLAGVSVAAVATAWVFVPRGLPAGERNVSVACIPGAGTSVFVAEATCALARKRWCEAPQPYRCEPGGANVPLELTVTAVGEQVRLSARFGQVAAASAAEAVTALAPAVRAYVGEGRSPLPASEAERAAARSHGTESIDAWRKYRRLVDLAMGVIYEDREAVLALEDELQELDPGWAHAWAAELITLKANGPRADETLAAARAAVTDRERDPAGSAMLDAIEAIRDDRISDALARLRPLFQAHSNDAVFGYLLFKTLYIQRATAEALATVRRLNESLPELQFGADLAAQLFEAGRRVELAELGESWLLRTPANEQAVLLALALAVERGDVARVRRLGADYLLVHGNAPRRWAALCDALTHLGLLDEAHVLADRLVAEVERSAHAAGLHRDGVLALYEGRFLAGQKTFASAAEAYAGGGAGAAIPSLDGLMTVQRLVGDADGARAAGVKLTDAYREFREPELAATVAYELELDAGRCPDPASFLSAVSDEAARNEALTAIRRAQAARGCGDCEKVLRAGFSHSERSSRALYDLGRCAVMERRLSVAEEAFGRAVSLASHVVNGQVRYSPVYRMLSRYELGGVLEAQGRSAEARAQYEAFVKGWGVAEAQVPEVKLARAALQRLR